MSMDNVFLDLADQSGLSFQRGEVVLGAASALRSSEVANNILGLGINSLHYASRGFFDGNAIDDIDPALLFVLFDYGLDMAPRTENEDVVNMDELGAYCKKMNETLGSVTIPKEKIDQIRLVAQKRFVLEEQLANLASPENQGAPEGGDV